MFDGWIVFVCRVVRRAASGGPGGWVKTPTSGLVLVEVGIERLSRNCEDRATSDSVWTRARGTLWCRVMKNVIRACMAWCALGAFVVQVEQSLCWKKDVCMVFGDLRQYAQKAARMSGRITGGVCRR